MGDDKSNILKRKMAASARDPGPVHLIADLPDRFSGEAARAFTEFYGEKSQMAPASTAVFSRLSEALAPFASVSAIYHFRFNGEKDFIVILDRDTALRAAGWSLSGTRELPDPKPDTVSAIDRRLAKRLAIRTAEIIFEKSEACGVLKGSVELLASGADPRRFEFTDDAQRMAAFSIGAKTIEGEELGTVTILAAELTIAAMREHYDKALVAAAKKWKRDLLVMAAVSPVRLRAALTEQEIDLGALMALKPGQVINLVSATIDDVTVTPEFRTPSKLVLKGALGNRDGARALKIRSVDF